MAFSLGHLFRTAGRGAAAALHGQTEAELAKRALERQQLEFGLRIAPQLRTAREGAALDQFLGSQPEGRDLAGRGLGQSAALGIYSSRLAARRAERNRTEPTPAQLTSQRRTAAMDLKARAQAEADYIARTNEQPSALGIYAALRAKRDYKNLDDATLRGVAAEAVGPKKPGNTDLQDVIRRAAEGLGIPATPPPPPPP